MTDYFSRFVEIGVMQKSKTSSEVVRVLKAICARHGIPKEIRSDSGLQYDSAELAQFTKNLEIKHSTSSPRYPRANREVERAVRTVKSILKKEKDPTTALLAYRAYRSTPITMPIFTRRTTHGKKVQNNHSYMPQTTEA